MRMKRLRTPMPPAARALAAVLAAGCLGNPARRTLRRRRRTGLGEAPCALLSGGPFHAAALVKRTIKGTLPRVVELEGFNSINGNTVQNGFAAGRACIVFLSATGRPGVYAPLTPTTPRMGLSADGVELVMGDPPFSIPVRPQVLQEGLALLLERDAAGALPDRAAAFLKDAWERPEIESRYLAVAFAGYLREPRAVPWVAQASGDKLLRLRLSAIDALKRIASPEAVEALRGLLKDERASVAQAAAEALLDLQRSSALEDLLAWAQRTSLETARMPAGDARRARPLAAIAKLLLFVDERGPLFPPERICPALLDLARQKDVEPAVASDALYVYGTLAQAPQMDALIELSDDPVYAQRALAAAALSRASMRATANLEAFRAWWKDARAAFGEDLRRQVAESAARSLADESDPDLHLSLVSILRMAPQPLALAAAAPMLLDDKKAARLDTIELLYARTPLALPFLLERAAWERDADRKLALDGLAALGAKHPRLRDLARRLARAALCEPQPTVRRSGIRASGALEDPRGMRALLESIRDPGTYEADDAAASIYRISARTLGFGVYEPYADQELGAQRLAGWWGAVEAGEKTPYAPPLLREPPEGAPEAGARQALEKMLREGDSRPAAAAFAELHRALPAGDPLWTRLLAAER
ncbi:MAG: HEAT repeat domain-containing protein, partial [Planctomycetota bacterium]|nr:HEAT repeat domain-containing protein [Planctomycetota bacterium]